MERSVGGRRAWRICFIAVLLAVFQTMAVVSGGPALAVPTCTYDRILQRIDIVIDPGQVGGLSVETAQDDLNPLAEPGAIMFTPNGIVDQGGPQCGEATNSNTALISVVGSDSRAEVETFFVYNGAGQFNPDIDWSVDLGTNPINTDDVLFLFGHDPSFVVPTDDVVTLTDGTFDVNGGGGPMLGVERVSVETRDGNDFVDGSALVGTTLQADLGFDNDWVSPGASSNDILTGGFGTDTVSYAHRTTSVTIVTGADDAGHDANGDCDLLDPGDELDHIHTTFEVLVTGSADDCILGDPNVDETFVPGEGADEVAGNPLDDDTLDWSSASAGVKIHPAKGKAKGQGADTFTWVFRYVGSPSNDTLIWDGSTAFFSGGSGIDRVDASAQAAGQSIFLDELDGCASLPDNCTGIGEPPDDLENVTGGSGNDSLNGNDLVNHIAGGGGAGDDSMTGYDGEDLVIGGAGNDVLDGSGADDTLRGGADGDQLLGAEGDDILNGGGGIDLGDGGAGGDVCISVESKFNCGTKSNPALTLHAFASKLAGLR